MFSEVLILAVLLTAVPAFGNELNQLDHAEREMTNNWHGYKFKHRTQF